MKLQKNFFAATLILFLAAAVISAGCGPSQLQQYFDSSAKQVAGQAPIISKPEVQRVYLAAKDGSGQNLDPLRYAVSGVHAKGKQVVLSPENAQAKLTFHITKVWTERAPASGGGALVGALLGAALGVGVGYATGSGALGTVAGLGGAAAFGTIGHGIEQSSQPVVVKVQGRLAYEEQIVLGQTQPDEPIIKKKRNYKIVTRKGKKVRVYEEDEEVEDVQAPIKRTVSIAPHGGGMATVTTDRRHSNWMSQYSDHTVEVHVPADTPPEQVKEMLNQRIGDLMAAVF